MQKLADTPHYKKAFQELNYDFGDFYLFENLVVAEIKSDIVFNWENHAKQVVTEISNLYEDNGKNIIYISNRINEYSVVPSDWLNFFKYSNTLKGYAIISQNQSHILEKLFFKSKMRRFNTLDKAIAWAHAILQQEEGKQNRYCA
jgi:archaellum biogenesis ATPase FlaH